MEAPRVGNDDRAAGVLSVPMRTAAVTVLAIAASLAIMACPSCGKAREGERDAAHTQATSTAVVLESRAASCVETRTVPSADADSPSILEITVQLDACRVVPVVADHTVTLDSLAPRGAVAGINGGYFEEHEKPVGWRRVAKVDRSPPWAGSKGGIVAFEGARAYVGPRGLLPFEAEDAVQCNPLLVEPDGQSGIRSDDGRRAARTTICDTGDGAIHFVLFLASAQDGPTLREASETLRASRARGGFGCRTALNLDGGPSTGAYFRDAAIGRSMLPRGRIVDALFVVPR